MTQEELLPILLIVVPLSALAGILIGIVLNKSLTKGQKKNEGR